ncbi:MAG: TrmH family RNA methyltransferase, partial [Bacteroidia bacterium]|nr:TrmH family RNA methyltransferase [Bacteroidia bacterium]
MQTTFYSSRFKKREFPIVVVTDHVHGELNIGSLFRICDAFGVERLILTGLEGSLGRKVRKTSRSTERVVDFEFQSDILSCVMDLKAAGYHLVSIEITEESRALHHSLFQPENPVAIIVGDERFGISEAVLDLSDDVFHIEMYGQNSSMNVA